MLNVFFRCTFGIPALMVVLLPVVLSTGEKSTPNMNTILADYKNIFMQDIEKLVDLFGNLCKSSRTERNLCTHNEELHAICHMLRRIKNSVSESKLTGREKELTLHACRQMETSLSCSQKRRERKKYEASNQQSEALEQVSQPSPTAFPSKAAPSDKTCRIHSLITRLKTCWQQLYFKYTNQ
ncbi:interleukin-7 isoform X2 [Protopterus annectens]|uniref:interleukin-7 isoform X2 n=1 Tax=Protopterus annectens TaxID=7888 RepID=UPI001CF9C300|nr:interleukin-7 isoform X2 [Protopterus annectens]